MGIASPLEREQHTRPRHNNPEKMCKNAYATPANGSTPLEKHLGQKDPRTGCPGQAEVTQEGLPAFDIYN